jgi:hypothetical protein
MRSRVLLPVLVASMVALALPGSSDARGSSRAPAGHSSGGGHSGPVGHSSHGRPGGSGAYHGRGGSREYHGRGGAGDYHPHGGSWGHPGGVRPGDQRGRSPHGFGMDRGVLYNWHGHLGWNPWFAPALGWDWYWGWWWPVGYYSFYDYDSYYGYDYDWYPYSSVLRVPPETEGGEPAAHAPETEGAEEPVNAAEPAAPATETSAVDLEVTPPAALVALNGVVIGSVNEFGPASDYLYLDAGEYTLEFSAPGYRTRTLHLTVSGGNTAVVSLDLDIDPAFTGQRTAPPSPGLPHGRRFDPDFGAGARQAEPPATPTDAGGASESTALVLHVSPPDAAVYVDGKLVGTAESLAQLAEGVEVSPGAHRVDVVAPGHTSKTVQVEAKVGKKVELSITLE